MRQFADLWHDETGSVAMEYGMIATVVSVALIVAIVTLGDNLAAVFGIVSDTSVNAMANGG